MVPGIFMNCCFPMLHSTLCCFCPSFVQGTIYKLPIYVNLTDRLQNVYYTLLLLLPLIHVRGVVWCF